MRYPVTHPKCLRLVSVVVPFFNESENVARLLDELKEVLSQSSQVPIIPLFEEIPASACP